MKDEPLADLLGRLGFHRRHTMLDGTHAVITRRHPRGVHTTAVRVRDGSLSPYEERDLKEHGEALDRLADPRDYVRTARHAYEAYRKAFGKTPEGGFAFRPGARTAIGINPGLQGIGTFDLDHHVTIEGPDPTRHAARMATLLLEETARCRAEARRQADATPIVERSAAIILAHALGDVGLVRSALSAPAAAPRVVHAFDERLIVKQENETTAVDGLRGVFIRRSAKHSWLVTNGKPAHGFSWNGTSLITREGHGLPNTVLSALVGKRLEEIVDHPWLRGIPARIMRAGVGGTGGHARLALKTAYDHVDLDEACRTAADIIQRHPGTTGAKP